MYNNEIAQWKLVRKKTKTKELTVEERQLVRRWDDKVQRHYLQPAKDFCQFYILEHSISS